MTAAQPLSERNPIQKKAAPGESLSVRLFSVAEVAVGIEISMCSSLGIVQSVSAGAR
jgi:hypothetical protein